jgi:hypothetical protein
MSDAITHLINGDLELFKQAINQSLYSKVGQAFVEKKKEIAQQMFSEEECSSCGEQIEEEKVPGPVVARRLAGGMPPHEAKTKKVGIRGKQKGHG